MKPRIGLALGSGSARGWAHIGVIRALRDAGIEPDIICGASIGAFVGAAAACGELDKLESWVRSLSWKEVLGFFDVGMNGGLIKGEKLLEFFTRHFADRDIHQLPIPFACVSTDLASGREIWFREGSIAHAVRASIALPGLFSPYLDGEGRYLVDGGLVNPVPVSLCRALGADVVIAVDLGADILGRRLRSPGVEADTVPDGWITRLRRLLGGNDGANVAPSLVDVLASSINIMQVRIARSRLAGEPADVLISPRLAQLGLLDFHRADEAIAEGKVATELMLPLLRNTLDNQ
ncbi:MAG TPA: patatin-like phospholipase RssA [Azospira sp.]|nr:patatin-like phospholipase RssA [Azospira sp.]